MAHDPPYIPTPRLIASSRLTAQELVLNFDDFITTLRYVTTAPELVFERLVANVRIPLLGTPTTHGTKVLQLSDSLKATYETGWQASPSSLVPHEAHAAGSDESPGALEACQIANQNLTRELQVANIALAQSQLANRKLVAELAELNEKVSAAGHAKNATSTAIVKANPTFGTFATSEIRSTKDLRQKTSKTVTLGGKYTTIPGILVGLTLLDIGFKTTVRASGHPSAIRLDSFEINLDTWADTTLYGAACAWLALEATDVDIQYGSYHTIEHFHWSKTPAQNARAITFKRAYASPPRVVVWLNLFDLGAQATWRVKTFATDVTATGFILHIDSWAESKLMWTMASWLAYSADRPAIASGSFGTREIRSSWRPQLYNSAFEPFPGGVFDKPPRVFLAINELEIDHDHNLRLKVAVDNVSAAGMTWHLDAWSDTVLRAAGASYIAFG